MRKLIGAMPLFLKHVLVYCIFLRFKIVTNAHDMPKNAQEAGVSHVVDSACGYGRQ